MQICFVIALGEKQHPTTKIPNDEYHTGVV
jgi:hypothetical protein